MRPALLHAARDRFVRADELWILLDEHQVYGRIPDLVVARLDVEALERRLAGGWLRGLNETELRGLRAMRPDRGTKLDRLARLMRVGPATARKVVAGLVRDNFAERTNTGSYARLAPVAPILRRVVSLEAKRSDPRAALVQAREHRLFADAGYVVFDAAFEQRFTATKHEYVRNGIGLLALDATGGHRVVLGPTRSPNRHVVALALSAERTLARLLSEPARPLPESRLPSASAGSGYQGRPLLVGPAASAVERLLRGASPPSPGLSLA
jgi:hypothetical protein